MNNKTLLMMLRRPRMKLQPQKPPQLRKLRLKRLLSQMLLLLLKMLQLK